MGEEMSCKKTPIWHRVKYTQVGVNDTHLSHTHKTKKTPKESGKITPGNDRISHLAKGKSWDISVPWSVTCTKKWCSKKWLAFQLLRFLQTWMFCFPGAWCLSTDLLFVRFPKKFLKVEISAKLMIEGNFSTISSEIKVRVLIFLRRMLHDKCPPLVPHLWHCQFEVRQITWNFSSSHNHGSWINRFSHDLFPLQ